MRITTLILLAAMLASGGGCSETGETTHSTTEDAVTDRPIEDVLRDHTDHLMAIDGVVSVGQAQCGETPCIRVGVRTITDSVRAQIPGTLEGHPVDLQELGTVRPLGDS